MGQRENLGAGYVYFTRVFLVLVIKLLSLRSPQISIDCLKRHQVHARILQRKQSMQLNIVMPTVEFSLVPLDKSKCYIHSVILVI